MAEFSGRVAAGAAGGGDEAEAALDEREKEPEIRAALQSLRLSALTPTPSSIEGRVWAALSDDAEPELARRRNVERASALRATPMLMGSYWAGAGMVLAVRCAWRLVLGLACRPCGVCLVVLASSLLQTYCCAVPNLDNLAGSRKQQDPPAPKGPTLSAPLRPKSESLLLRNSPKPQLLGPFVGPVPEVGHTLPPRFILR